MLFTSIFTLALAAVSIAAPAPSPVELEDRAVSFESISIGLTVVINTYRSSPSSNNRLNLCRIVNGLSPAQRTRLQSLGFDFSRLQCTTLCAQLNAIAPGLDRAYQAYLANPNTQNTAALCAITSRLSAAQRSRIAALGITLNVQCQTSVSQLNAIQAGLGQAYQAYTQNPTAQNTAALCAITSQLTAAQRSRIAALGITLNVQCPTITSQLNAIRAGLGAAYQAYTRNPSQQNTAALCAITTQLTAAQQTSVTALGINLGNVQCPQNVDQQLNAIAPGLATAYDALAAAPTVFANQLAYCQITNGLTAQQTAQLTALNLNGAAGLQCTNVLLQNRLNNNFGAGFGDAYFAFQATPSAANRATLCGLTAQLTTAQRNRLRNNLNIDVTTFGCN
ncbi:hypothetical protein CYLTODRAFT_456041 [Cylindrobasidium torrendii FP15055 ss-10]|uniref:Uncharacterized protein n=1 Tax=Cylindrobasidium torrendii FP15055 ss-10 TaxID=1314674 RepID=A0A0D7B6A3_9AGAR|nr:hypothetical protein CYLTODRAFT_456041 [Cylindrobasidium torrendii FP15055 ss-10]